jgi:hypothetical protein
VGRVLQSYAFITYILSNILQVHLLAKLTMGAQRSRLSALLLLAAVICWADASLASRVMLSDAEPAAVASALEGEHDTCLCVPDSNCA